MVWCFGSPLIQASERWQTVWENRRKMTKKLKMKINKLLIVILIVSFFACKNGIGTSTNGLSRINSSEIEIEEKKKRYSDTLSVKLDKEQIEKVVKMINESNNKELRKAIPKYWLFIRLKNDSIKTYKINGNYFGENDSYIKMENNNYLQEIYENNSKSKYLIEIKYR